MPDHRHRQRRPLPGSRDEVERSQDVVWRSGPASAVAAASVLDVPCDIAMLAEVDGEGLHRVSLVLLTPEATVDEGDHPRWGARGYPEIPHIVRVRSISNGLDVPRRPVAEMPKGVLVSSY